MQAIFFAPSTVFTGLSSQAMLEKLTWQNWSFIRLDILILQQEDSFSYLCFIYN